MLRFLNQLYIMTLNILMKIKIYQLFNDKEILIKRKIYSYKFFKGITSFKKKYKLLTKYKLLIKLAHKGRMFKMRELLQLTEQQKSIWNTELFYSGTSINNIGGYIYIEEQVDFDILTKTANLYVKHNDNSRIHFISKENEVYQYVSDYKKFDVA